MLRRFFLLSAACLAAPAPAQAQSGPLAVAGADCQIQITAAPTTWMIQGYDPFGGTLPEATFGVTMTNQGSAECRFTPVIHLDQPPFGLSRGTGRQIGYALLNMTDSIDVTPRAGRSVRRTANGSIVLAPNESRTVLYKLIADPDDIKDAGIFTEDVTIEAQDAEFRSLGGGRVVLGITVLPSARLGLAGAYTVNDGHATVDLGELRPGPAPVPLQLRVNSTGRYDLAVSSANRGRLRLGATEWQVPYSVSIGGNQVDLSGSDTLSGPTGEGFRRDALPLHFVIGEVAGQRAGTYSDVISITVSAR